jgi:hypothetical protein
MAIGAQRRRPYSAGQARTRARTLRVGLPAAGCQEPRHEADLCVAEARGPPSSPQGEAQHTPLPQMQGQKRWKSHQQHADDDCIVLCCCGCVCPQRHEGKWSERPPARKTISSTTTTTAHTHTHTLDHTAQPSLTHRPRPSGTAMVMGGTQGPGAKAWGAEEGPVGQAVSSMPMQLTSHHALAHTQVRRKHIQHRGHRLTSLC